MKTWVLALAAFGLVACEAKEEAAPAPSQAEAPQREAPQTAAPIKPANAIPAAFHGRWDKDAAACNNAESTQIVTVRESEVQFFESMAKVKSVTEDGPNAVRFEGTFSGEGEESESAMRLEMSPAGDTLKIDGGANGLLVRCPASGR